VHVPPPAFLRAQVDACFADFRIAAVKLGMLANARVINAVADALEEHDPKFIVLDPVMVASSGARLLEEDALDALRRRLLPLATRGHPNIPEAELLLGHAIPDGDAAEAALVELLALGAPAVLLKGGHLPGRKLIDRLDDGWQLHEFEHPRLKVEGHGTGCTLASAIAAQLALGATCRRPAPRPPTTCMARCAMLPAPGARNWRSSTISGACAGPAEAIPLRNRLDSPCHFRRETKMRSGNPVLGENTFLDVGSGRVVSGDSQSMTINGTVNKTGLMLAVLLVGAAFTWSRFDGSPESAQAILPWWRSAASVASSSR
jgi:hydroxymethylpyrimidine kinase/phosphomethylpyrimidine kinase